MVRESSTYLRFKNTAWFLHCLCCWYSTSWISSSLEQVRAHLEEVWPSHNASLHYLIYKNKFYIQNVHQETSAIHKWDSFKQNFSFCKPSNCFTPHNFMINVALIGVLVAFILLIIVYSRGGAACIQAQNLPRMMMPHDKVWINKAKPKTVSCDKIHGWQCLAEKRWMILR